MEMKREIYLVRHKGRTYLDNCLFSTVLARNSARIDRCLNGEKRAELPIAGHSEV